MDRGCFQEERDSVAVGVNLNEGHQGGRRLSGGTVGTNVSNLLCQAHCRRRSRSLGDSEGALGPLETGAAANMGHNRATVGAVAREAREADVDGRTAGQEGKVEVAAGAFAWR